MKCEVVPSEVSKTVPLSASSYSSYLSETVENTYGIISKNGLWLYLVQDTVINIYHTESGKWCGGHCFSESLNNPSAKISAAVEFSSSHISYPCLLLAVNQDHESLLCMFDINSCTVQRSVLIPDRITSLDVVSENGGACIGTHFLSRKLRFMFGVVAIGTLHGHLFFLDLCLDENFSCDEKLPNITTVVRKQDFSSQKREAAIAKKQHIFLHMNDESTIGGSFEFKSISNTLGRYPNGEVYVTAMKYVQSLATLAVGFSFGGIQLWELHNLTLQYTISDHHDQSIVSFAFQEPENDPRNFCYLWVVKGHITGEDELPISTSVSTLYSLTYYKRDYLENFGALYTELQSCNKRFEFPLTNDSFNSLRSNTSIGTRLISCQVVDQKDVHHVLDTASANESDSVSEDMSLCLLSWEVWLDSGNAPPTYHLAVFDLNQWYQAHMPFNFRCSPSELNPYLGLFSLDEIGYNFLEEGILGFHVVPQTVKKFKSLLVSEEFFYPSSLEFQLLCFTENGLRKASYFGFQKHLLYRMADLGPQVLLNPKDLCALLIKSGLVPDTFGGIDRTPLTNQKEALLQLALEHNLPFFFMKCLKEWRYSDSMHEYCNSKALLTWAWKKVISIKSSIDKICVPLFNGSGEDVDKASLKYLYSYKKQLNLIDRIMAGYQKYVTPRTEQGLQELQCRKDAVSSVNMYLQVVLWLRSSQILPENVLEEGASKSLTYQYENLNTSYKIRRMQLQKLHRMVDPGDVLLIDGIVKELGISTSWIEKSGTEMYPPPSIYAAVSCYLLDGVSIELKHSLMYYFLLDLKSSNEAKALSQEIKKFIVVFGIPKHLVKIIKASWYLDQKNTVYAIQKLSHPCVKSTDILPWQHHRIMKSFLCWKAPKRALKYINHMEPPQNNMDAMKLHLSILLACGAVTQGWEYQRTKLQEGYGNELMNHFFLGCQEMHKMKDLMYLPLNSLESSSLVDFLSDNKDPKAQEYLVIYHLLHCNFFEAMKVNDKLAKFLVQKCLHWNGTPVEKRTIDRGFLVENLMTAVSSVEKCLVEEMRRFPFETTKRDETLQPMSVSLKGDSSLKKTQTYSDIIRSVICRDSPCTSKQDSKSRGSCIEDLPFLRPPVTPQSVSSRLSETIRSGSGLVAKRTLNSTSPTEFSSPAKKSRLLDNVPFMGSPLTRRTPKNLAGDIAALLQTPPIAMRTPNAPVRSYSQSNSAIKPQSILKKKKELPEHIKLNFLTCSTPSASEAESSDGEVVIDEVKVSDDVNNKPKKDSTEDTESQSKQLRFDLPEAEKSAVDLSQCPASPGIDFVGKVVPDSPCPFSYDGAVEEDSDQFSPEKILTQSIEFSEVKETASSSEADDVVMDVERSETQPSVPSSLHSGASFSLRDEYNLEDDFLTTSKASDPGVLTVSNTSAVFRFTASSAGDDATQQNYSPVFQKSSCVTSRPPLRQGSESEDISEDQGIEISSYSVTQSQLQRRSTFNTFRTENSPSQSAREESVSNLSDSEIFYSPSADSPIQPRTTFTFAQPVTLFPDSSASRESDSGSRDFRNTTVASIPQIDLEPVSLYPESSQSNELDAGSGEFRSATVVSVSARDLEPVSLYPESSASHESDSQSRGFGNAAVASTLSKDSEGSNDTVILSNSDTSKDGMDTSEDMDTSCSTVKHITDEDSISVAEVPSVEAAKPPRRTFVFTKNIPSSDASGSTAANKSSDRKVAENPPVLDVQMDEETSSADPCLVSEQPSVKPPRRTFVFTKTVLHSHTTASIHCPELQAMEQEPNKAHKNPQIVDVVANRDIPDKVKQTDPPLLVPQDISEPPVTTKGSKKKFVFTKTVTAAPVDKTSRGDEVEELPSTGKRNTRSSRRTFVFTRNVMSIGTSPLEESEHSAPDEQLEEEMQSSESQSSEKTKFLGKQDAETYEEFSKSLKQGSSESGTKQKTDKKPILSSPTVLGSVSNPVSTDKSSSKSNIISGKKTAGKSVSLETVDKMVGTTPKVSKKKKTKGTTAKKMEFSFAEPHSPADSEILEALAKSPEAPLPSFMFSPPLTRGRLRKKRLDDTMGSSFSSMVSEVSFTKPRTPPPIDPILEGIILEKNLGTKRKPRVSSHTKSATRRSSVRKAKAQHADVSEKSLLLSPVQEAKSSPSKRNSPSSPRNTSLRHSMVLRQTKPKPDSLF